MLLGNFKIWNSGGEIFYLLGVYILCFDKFFQGFDCSGTFKLIDFSFLNQVNSWVSHYLESIFDIRFLFTKISALFFGNYQFTYPTLISDPYSSLNFLYSGLKCLQWPHQGTWNNTIQGTSVYPFYTDASKFLEVSSNTSPFVRQITTNIRNKHIFINRYYYDLKIC